MNKINYLMKKSKSLNKKINDYFDYKLMNSSDFIIL